MTKAKKHAIRKTPSKRTAARAGARALTEADLKQVAGGKGSSPTLMQACATGVHIKKGILTV